MQDRQREKPVAKVTWRVMRDQLYGLPMKSTEDSSMMTRKLNEKAQLPVIGVHKRNMPVYHVHNSDCQDHKHPKDRENDKHESQGLVLSKEFHLFQHTLALLCI